VTGRVGGLDSLRKLLEAVITVTSGGLLLQEQRQDAVTFAGLDTVVKNVEC
jgi:hypothetical protein